MLIFADEPSGGGTANPAPGDSGDPAPAGDNLPPTLPDNGLPANDPNGESTTPEEVAAVMKNAGVNLSDEPANAAGDDEEGDDPDAAAGDEDGAAAGDDDADAEDEDVVVDADKNKPAPVDTTTDDKYSFEVEDANGVTFKVPVGAKMEDVLKEFEPKNNGQILDILDQLRDMKAQKASDDAAEAENTAKTEQAQRVSDIRKGWDSEVTDLTAQKRIPEGTEGEDRVKEVYKFMADENGKRMEAGKPTIGSFEDALDKLEAKENREAAAQAEKDAKEEARKNGSKVGGSSAPATSGAPAYRAGSARNANEAIRAMGLIK